jgi:hypothetical protein
VTDYRQNEYSDDDMRDIIAEIEGLDDEAQEIMASAMGKVAGLRKKQKAAKKRAKDDLSIPMGVLVPLLKRRALEKKMKKLEDEVAEELIEVFQDAAGQFSFLNPAPEAEAKPKKPKKAKADDKPWPDDAAKKNADAEQKVGGEIVDSVGKPHDSVGFVDAR